MLLLARASQHLTRLWRGELPLASAFWNWAVFGGLTVNGIAAAALLILIINDQPLAALLAGHIVSVPYNILVAVGVWRSAGRYEGDPRLRIAARVITTSGMLLLSIV